MAGDGLANRAWRNLRRIVGGGGGGGGGEVTRDRIIVETLEVHPPPVTDEVAKIATGEEAEHPDPTDAGELGVVALEVHPDPTETTSIEATVAEVHPDPTASELIVATITAAEDHPAATESAELGLLATEVHPDPVETTSLEARVTAEEVHPDATETNALGLVVTEVHPDPVETTSLTVTVTAEEPHPDATETDALGLVVAEIHPDATETATLGVIVDEAQPAATDEAALGAIVAEIHPDPTETTSLTVTVTIDEPHPATAETDALGLVVAEVHPNPTDTAYAFAVIEPGANAHSPSGTAWTNPANAVGRNNGANATSTGGGIVGERGIVLAYADFPATLTHLTITQVILRFYVQQSGTVLNNGFLELIHNRGGVGDVRLALYAGDVNFLAAPVEFDVTADYTTWAKLNALTTWVKHGNDPGELHTAALDAVHVRISAEATY